MSMYYEGGGYLIEVMVAKKQSQHTILVFLIRFTIHQVKRFQIG